ncbi:YqgE/AlgH family protein [Puniceicoccales bacterium CK1056]|uniref:YqgE/AlgH family protein n=1 Tax=Oceanipulchritudo coccoides TaxID=2706888 RepID=A0A6B2LZW8_9BACT|nr:YqgE/AlgH family protein [Oceanipulchritudo coccoides]NDV61317.1 YqgE/AlgH family protein [Oceanipulchritudo coccoides]
MDETPTPVQSLAGFLLGAHPNLIDPNFNRSVVLLSAHSNEDGALGVIINRPTGKSLGALREDMNTPLLENLPVYEGGPVSPEEILLVAWKWNLSRQHFRLFFGLEPDKLQELVDADPTIEARAFLGYSGWSAGQLETEVSRFDWAISPFVHPFGKMPPQNLWRQLLEKIRPEWGVLADFPDDPSVN